jgi:hypothetical protein
MGTLWEQFGFGKLIRVLDACLAGVIISQNCPQQWRVFAQASLGAAPTICMSGPITTCPTSQTPSLSFPFQLVSGTTIEGCLASQGVIQSCANYSPWNGGIVVDQGGNIYGCSRSATTCPAGLLAFWQANPAPAAPTLVQCRPPLSFGQPAPTPTNQQRPVFNQLERHTSSLAATLVAKPAQTLLACCSILPG